MKKMTKNYLAWAGGITALLLLAAGCATPSTTATKNYYFFPPPPNDPRLQFLTGFSTEKDFQGAGKKSFMEYVTGEEAANKGIGKPYGAAAYGKKLYVCDTDAGAVLVADLQQKRIGVLETGGEGALSSPLNITFDADGSYYIADAGREQVILFDKDGNYAATLGKTGEMEPRDVAVSQTRIYVADIQKRNVRVYDKATRNLLFEIPRDQDKTNLDHSLFLPINLALDSNGNVYVSDTTGCRVQVYDAEGRYLRTVGSIGDAPGQFARVKGLAVDRENRLYAVDAMSGVTQIFNDKGQLLTWFGDPQFQSLPAKVLVDYDDVSLFQSYAAPHFKVEYLVIVINQVGSHKVSVYGFGQMN